jgi:hypothetical protein
MLITTGSATSAKQGRLRSTPSARRLTRELAAGQRALRPRALARRALCRRMLARRAPRPGARGAPAVLPPVVRQLIGRQRTASAVVPITGPAGLAACCRVGTRRQGRRPLTRKLARLPLTCQLAAASAVPQSARALVMLVHSPAFRSRTRRGTRTPPLTRRPPRCRPARRERGQTTAGRGPMATGRSPVKARACQSRARHGRRQDRLQPGAVRDIRRDPAHRGPPRRGPAKRASRRRSGPSGLPAVAGLNALEVLQPPRSSARPRRRQPRRQP